MVDHPEMIKIIILAETSLTNGDYFPNVTRVGLVNAVKPKILVYPQVNRDFTSSGFQYSEFYDLYLESISLAGLETNIEDILGVSSLAASGYTKSVAAYPFFIHPRLTDKMFDKNRFTAKFEVEARWDIP